ncbi:MAG: NAD-dependent epimerase/dehydratase family protein [Syntrophorhabdales bacterium]|jgi:nucleoside-diphosphate-sugar epimerase
MQNLVGKKALVTGASGFIGSHLCRSLLREGAIVHAVSRKKHPDRNEDILWHQGDLSEKGVAEVLLASARPDLIFHLAGYPVGARKLENVMPAFRSNLMTTVNLLTAASEIGCSKIVLTGSLEEPQQYGEGMSPSSPYAASKLASSAYGQMFQALFQLPVVILRVFMVYGPEQSDDSKLIPYVTLSLLTGKEPKLTSGRRLVDWIYVEDVAEAFLAAARSNHIEGLTLDVGSGVLVPISAIVEHLVRITGARVRPCFGFYEDRPMEQERVADIARPALLMDWRPRVPLEQGLAKTVDWYRTRLLSGATSPPSI